MKNIKFVYHGSAVKHQFPWNSTAKEEYTVSQGCAQSCTTKINIWSSVVQTSPQTSPPPQLLGPAHFSFTQTCGGGERNHRLKYSIATWQKSHPNINLLKNPCQTPPPTPIPFFHFYQFQRKLEVWVSELNLSMMKRFALRQKCRISVWMYSRQAN